MCSTVPHPDTQTNNPTDVYIRNPESELMKKCLKIIVSSSSFLGSLLPKNIPKSRNSLFLWCWIYKRSSLNIISHFSSPQDPLKRKYSKIIVHWMAIGRFCFRWLFICPQCIKIRFVARLRTLHCSMNKLYFLTLSSANKPAQKPNFQSLMNSLIHIHVEKSTEDPVKRVPRGIRKKEHKSKWLNYELCKNREPKFPSVWRYKTTKLF